MKKKIERSRLIISIKVNGKGNHKKNYLVRITKKNIIITKNKSEAVPVRAGRIVKYFEILKKAHPDCKIKFEKVDQPEEETL